MLAQLPAISSSDCCRCRCPCCSTSIAALETQLSWGGNVETGEESVRVVTSPVAQLIMNFFTRTHLANSWYGWRVMLVLVLLALPRFIFAYFTETRANVIQCQARHSHEQCSSCTCPVSNFGTVAHVLLDCKLLRCRGIFSHRLFGLFLVFQTK